MTLDLLIAIFAGLFGLLLGSFLNVCILRWGAEPKQSVVRPPSSCPGCGHRIRWYENVPVFSWLALRGKCSACRAPISILYPAVELGTAILWFAAFAIHGADIGAVRLALASALLAGIAISDARGYIIPHEFSIGGTAIALGLSAYPDPQGLVSGLQGALFGAGLILVTGELTELLLGQEAMGGGDCALMGMVGAFFGWESVAPVVGVGALVSLILYFVTGHLQRETQVQPALPDAPPAPDLEEAGGLRWSKVLLLLGIGLLGIAFLSFALYAGFFDKVLRWLFLGFLGAGVAYYVLLVVPRRFLSGAWVGVGGLLGAAVAIIIADGMTVWGWGVGAAVAVSALWAARRRPVEPSPETTMELSSKGYVPFGVGLSIAAALLAFTGVLDQIRSVFTDMIRALGV